jgi:hypothetical protein
LLNKKPNEILEPFLLIKLGLYKIINNKVRANPILSNALNSVGKLKITERTINNNWVKMIIKKENVQICIFLK